jgi:peptide/nickel transport system permease protein
MIGFLLRRLFGAALTLLVVSVIVFWIIELPPGDAADIYLAKKFQGGGNLTPAQIAEVRSDFGLDQPFLSRWWSWISDIIFRFDFGESFANETPVNKLIGDRMLLTIVIIFATLFVTYGLAIPIGVYAAIRRYSITDYAFTTLGYIGLALPNFLLALVLLWISVRYFGSSVGGLFSPEYESAGWSVGKAVDLIKHLWVPIVVLGTANLAFQLQTVRAMMLDETNKLYVTAARARGLPERTVITRYPMRQALTPIVSTFSFDINRVLSDAPVVALVLALPELGELLITSLLEQDTHVAGAILLMMSFIYVAGNLVADVVLAAIDPRVRVGAQ